jgi:DNA-binding beta-propeller fold protein YncE
VTVGPQPLWIAVNPETNKVYVGNFGRGPAAPSLMVVNGASNVVTSTLQVGDVGWTAINPVTNKAYVIRYGNGDEVSIVHDEGYVNTAATRSYVPISIAVNPYNSILYIVHSNDVVALDMTSDSLYPRLLCPDGSGGFKPQIPPGAPDGIPCINVPDVPVAVTVNPVTDKVYAVSSATSGQISVINGYGQPRPHEFVALTPPGVGSVAKAIALNPVTNRIYAAFAGHVVAVDGANHAMTVIASGTTGGPVAIGINTTTNTIYVPNSDGTLTVIDGATNAASTLAIPSGAKAIAVNPVTNTIYVLTASGVTPIVGAGTPQAIPLATAVTPLPGNESGPDGSITLTASSSSGFAAARKVYFQIDSTTGPWQAAGGSGPYTATFSGLAPGSHTLRAFATNALDAPSIMTDVQNNPLVGSIASYAFTVTGTPSPVDPSIAIASSSNPSTVGSNVTFTASVSGSAGPPTGTVNFLDGASAISGCTGVALSSGAAACTTNALSAGTHSITARYSGNTSYNARTSAAIAQAVKANAAIALASSANPSTAGNNVTFTATVSGSVGTPTGTVNFLDGASAIPGCSGVALSAGAASCTTNTLSAGTRSITAQYSGSASYHGGTSTALSQVVNAAKVNVSIALAASPSPSNVGQNVTLTATLSGPAGTPTGTVDFRDGSSPIAGCAARSVASGSAACTTPNLGAGTHSITAAYSGNASYNAGTSAAIGHTVNASPPAKVNASIALASSANPSTAGQAVTFTASLSGAAGTPTGAIDFRAAGAPISACSGVALASGSATCVTSSLAAGDHSITVQYGGDGSYNPGTSAAIIQTVQAASAPQAGLSSTSVAFGGQSMGTTAGPGSITVTNVGTGTLAISGISISDPQFAQSNDCGSLAPGASCTIHVWFTPAPAPGPINSATAVSGTLSIVSNAVASPNVVSLSGTAEKSLASHYYRAILGRAPDAGGKAFWESEAQRVAGLGANVNETWYAMAAYFFTSGEYSALGRDHSGFVTDLYNTFFNRPADANGHAFWTDQLSAGMPREVVLASFMFSPEFASFTRGIFGNTAARAEVDTVGDFYRGLLSRLPETDGFNHYLREFRNAQCRGAGDVYAQVQAISKAFAEGPEYAGRNRNNAQYIGDLYNAFLRRGGDVGGVQFWIRELDSGARTRAEVRQSFISSPEFSDRVNAIIAEGCMP